jgi:hypothetical protein
LILVVKFVGKRSAEEDVRVFENFLETRFILLK